MNWVLPGHGPVGITVSWKCIWEFFPLQSILWTKLRHLLWVQEFAGFCCINLIKLWAMFPIVSYSVCFSVRVGQKEELESRTQSTRLESRSKAKLLFSEIFVVRYGQMKKCLVGFDSPSFYIQPVFSTVGSTSHPHVCLQWNTAATYHASLPELSLHSPTSAECAHFADFPTSSFVQSFWSIRLTS